MGIPRFSGRVGDKLRGYLSINTKDKKKKKKKKIFKTFFNKFVFKIFYRLKNMKNKINTIYKEVSEELGIDINIITAVINFYLVKVRESLSNMTYFRVYIPKIGYFYPTYKNLLIFLNKYQQIQKKDLSNKEISEKIKNIELHKDYKLELKLKLQNKINENKLQKEAV